MVRDWSYAAVDLQQPHPTKTKWWFIYNKMFQDDLLRDLELCVEQPGWIGDVQKRPIQRRSLT